MGLPRYTQSVNEGNITQWHIIKFERLLISNMTRIEVNQKSQVLLIE